MQKYANLVELEKCCRFLQNFVLIQPRTSPPKICKKFQKISKKLLFLLILTPNQARDLQEPARLQQQVHVGEDEARVVEARDALGDFALRSCQHVV